VVDGRTDGGGRLAAGVWRRLCYRSSALRGHAKPTGPGGLCIEWQRITVQARVGCPPSAPSDLHPLPRPHSMISYEVTARLDARVAEAYERYLRDVHIPDLMATGCFVEAAFARQEAVDKANNSANTSANTSANDSASVCFRSSYVASDEAALQRYFREHAERLRGDALARFPSGLQLTREQWSVMERWKAHEGVNPVGEDGGA
jgi:hypothetical protein